MHILGTLMGFFAFSGAVMALPASASAPSVPVLPSCAVTLTAYNAVPAQTDNEPLMTASGAYSNPETVAARSQDLASKLPFGTIIEIVGPSISGDLCGYDIVKPLVGYRVIADTMNARYTDRIDILFSTTTNYAMADGIENASTVLGVCNTVVHVVGFIDITNPNHLPKTQADLTAIVKDDGGLALK